MTPPPERWLKPEAVRASSCVGASYPRHGAAAHRRWIAHSPVWLRQMQGVIDEALRTFLVH